MYLLQVYVLNLPLTLALVPFKCRYILYFKVSATVRLRKISDTDSLTFKDTFYIVTNILYAIQYVLKLNHVK